MALEEIFKLLTAQLDAMAEQERAFWRSPAGMAKREAQRVATTEKLARQFEELAEMKKAVDELDEERSRLRESMKTMKRGSVEWREACAESTELSRILGEANAAAHEFAKTLRNK